MTTALPNALTGDRVEMASATGTLSYYRSTPVSPSGPPLLLVHSVNAAGSAYEMKPIYEHYRAARIVYALDLPGFGFSNRADLAYDPRIMTDAVRVLTDRIRSDDKADHIDAMALSLGCELLARAASENPDHFRALGLISPTGMDSSAPYDGAAGTTRGKAWLHAVFRNPLWSEAIFAALTSRASIRYFLKKTWGSEQIDEGLFEYDYLTTHQPGARHAPYRFVSGYLFSADITRVYDALTMPIWVVHGTRGDFVDYAHLEKYKQQANWTVEKMPTGALPHFELPSDFMRRYTAFLAKQAASP